MNFLAILGNSCISWRWRAIHEFPDRVRQLHSLRAIETLTVTATPLPYVLAEDATWGY